MFALAKLYRVKTLSGPAVPGNRSPAEDTAARRHFCARVIAAQLAVLALVALGIAAAVAL